MKTYDTREVIAFAGEELKKYLLKLGVSADITLGLFEDVGKSNPVEDPSVDDAFEIQIVDKKGYAVGSNGRSVLFAVYRLLEEWGIGWVRPGKDGTFIPKTTAAADLFISEKADSRHRIMCIEGAITIENALDMIDWIPKLGFNAYYIQFNDAFIFFDRYYGHRNNPFKNPEHFDYDMALKNVDIMIDAIKQRGLMLQRMGHGWNCDPFGIPNHGWDPLDPSEISEEYVNLCAEVDGVRRVWKNIPMATQLCYSNPYVAKTMGEAVVNYFVDHPETDLAHFWLGDYPNNTCECPECAKLHYSDYYVNMINIATEGLLQKGLKDKKIAFSCGYNKAWPPIREKLKHPEMLLLTMAPISRTFGEPFPSEFKVKSLPTYEINKYALPRSVDENLASLYEWEQVFDGDIVDFDYHLMWDHILDAGGEGIARIIHTDINNFEALGLSGYISCQLQRNAFPTSIAMTVMGKTLWNKNADFEAVRHRLYADSFGEGAKELKDYFEILSNGFNIGHIRSQVKTDRKDFIDRLGKAVEAFENADEIINRHLNDENECHRASWKYLSLHKAIYMPFAQGLIEKLKGNNELGDKLIKDSVKTAWEKEDEVQSVFDTFFYNDVVPFRVNLEKAAEFYDF